MRSVIVTLRPIGNSQGVLIPKAVLSLLRIERDTLLEITTDGIGLIVKPVRPLPESSQGATD